MLWRRAFVLRVGAGVGRVIERTRTFKKYLVLLSSSCIRTDARSWLWKGINIQLFWDRLIITVSHIYMYISLLVHKRGAFWEVLHRNAVLSGVHWSGFRCCLLWCLSVSRSQVRECRALQSRHFPSADKKTVGDSMTSATVHIYAQRLKTLCIVSIFQMSFMLQVTGLLGILQNSKSDCVNSECVHDLQL